MPTEKSLIHLSLAAIMKEVKPVAKDRKNEAQGFKFRGIEDCLNALHPAFAAHGVTCIPYVEKVDLSEYKNAKGNTVFRSVAIVEFRFTASDGSVAVAKAPGEGHDHGDKATAKAMSMALKAALVQSFLIPTQDMIDADAYDPTVDPHEEIRALRDQQAKAAVDKAIETGEPPELPTADAEALTERRRIAQAALDEHGPAGKPVDEVKPPGNGKKEKAKVTPPAARPEPAKPIQPAPADPKTVNEYTIVQVSTPEYHGRKLKDLTMEELERLKVMWIDRFAKKIAADPARQHEAGMILAALAERIRFIEG